MGPYLTLPAYLKRRYNRNMALDVNDPLIFEKLSMPYVI
jgi:hypothetical protein